MTERKARAIQLETYVLLGEEERLERRITAQSSQHLARTHKIYDESQRISRVQTVMDGTPVDLLVAIHYLQELEEA